MDSEDRQNRLSRRKFIRFGLFGWIGAGAIGATSAAIVVFSRHLPTKVKVEALKRVDSLRPQPVLYDYDLSKAFFVAEYPKGALKKAEDVYPESVLEGMRAGVVVLSKRCPHLGAPVEWCTSSQWFECPSHGSQFNAVGEKKGGPAPSGMNLFEVSLTEEVGVFEVDTTAKVKGVRIGVNTTGQVSEGIHCTSGRL